MNFLLLLVSIISIYPSQRSSEEPLNNPIIEKQKVNTQNVLHLFQKGETETAKSYFEIASDKEAKKIDEICKEIELLPSITEYTIVIVFPEGFNVFRCTFLSGLEPMYQIDFYYNSEDSNSKIKKFNTKNRDVLMKEKELRNNNNELPPIPPSP
jgi:hypothetical protein